MQTEPAASAGAETTPDPFILVIFGASGDLAFRKLMPSIFNLFQKDQLPSNFYIVGCARTQMDDGAFRQKVAEAVKSTFPQTPRKMLDVFTGNIFYISGQYDSIGLYRDLDAKLAEIEAKNCPKAGRIFYLAVPAALYTVITRLLHESGTAVEDVDGIPYRRVIIEKPFGYDLDSAVALEKSLKGVLAERQIYRIDHYLGKDTVQNILMLRFANMIFEPLWNNRYIDHVQITVAESIGVEHRAGYFDGAGLLRDMFQNHMLEMLCLMAMEPPASFSANHVRDEKAKLLNSIRPFETDEIARDLVRAQYSAGTVGGEAAKGYLEEDGVPQTSTTETFVAAKVRIGNWRWNGVPFYLRAGKRLKRRVSEIAVTFKKIPYSIFSALPEERISQNVLVLNVQPEDGFALQIQAKKPGPKLSMGDLRMNFLYRDMFKGEPADAYERLLLDCMLGDSTLFIRDDTIRLSWSLLTPILNVWADKGNPAAGRLCHYPAGTWGPPEADALLSDGRKWREP